MRYQQYGEGSARRGMRSTRRARRQSPPRVGARLGLVSVGHRSGSWSQGCQRAAQGEGEGEGDGNNLLTVGMSSIAIDVGKPCSDGRGEYSGGSMRRPAARSGLLIPWTRALIECSVNAPWLPGPSR
jgi:hypothetical protein